MISSTATDDSIKSKEVPVGKIQIAISGVATADGLIRGDQVLPAGILAHYQVV